MPSEEEWLKASWWYFDKEGNAVDFPRHADFAISRSVGISGYSGFCTLIREHSATVDFHDIKTLPFLSREQAWELGVSHFKEQLHNVKV